MHKIDKIQEVFWQFCRGKNQIFPALFRQAASRLFSCRDVLQKEKTVRQSVPF